jgi:hypothetical protein
LELKDVNGVTSRDSLACSDEQPAELAAYKHVIQLASVDGQQFCFSAESRVEQEAWVDAIVKAKAKHARFTTVSPSRKQSKKFFTVRSKRRRQVLVQLGEDSFDRARDHMEQVDRKVKQ